MNEKSRAVFNDLFKDVFVPMMKMQAESYRAGMKAQEEIEKRKEKDVLLPKDS